MINLLAPNYKKDFSYGRRNVTLMRWLIALVIALIILLAIGTAGTIYMKKLSDNYQKQISSSQHALELEHIVQVQQNAKDISGDIKLAVDVLSKEILFSKLLNRLAAVTPKDVVLSNLNIAGTSGSLTITAEATNYRAATQLQTNLADPNNNIFASADLEDITCDKTKLDKTKYICEIKIQALFAKDNPFLFINQGRSQAP